MRSLFPEALAILYRAERSVRRFIPSPRTLLKTTAACLSVIVGLGIAEVFVRVALPQDLEVLSSWYVSHPIYRFRHYPNMDTVKSTEGERYRIRTNRQGLRAEQDEAYESPLETRIVVHGDSLTFGVGVDNKDTFVHRAQESLRRKMAHIDVLNLGVANSGPSEQYLLFQEEGRKYSPRIVVIAVFGNDLDDVTRPLNAFRLQSDRLVYVPYRPSAFRRFSERRAYRWLQDRSHLLTLLRVTLANAVERDRFVPSDDTDGSSLPLALAIYRDFVTAIRNQNAVPVILLLPSMEQIALRKMEAAEKPSVSSTLLREGLLQFCVENAITCVDALEGFARTDVPTERVIIAGDDHCNAAGHEIVAAVLEEPLERILESLSAQ